MQKLVTNDQDFGYTESLTKKITTLQDEDESQNSTEFWLLVFANLRST